MRLRVPSRKGIAWHAARAFERLQWTIGSRGRRRRQRLLTGTVVRPSTRPRRGAFRYEKARRRYQHPAVIEDRLYNYVFYPGDENVLCIHFSAFFGEWGERPRARAHYGGYFHRLRMFWPLTRYNFLFLCDTFGAEKNGTYYKGENGDFFVERASDELIAQAIEVAGAPPMSVVTLGSSMGATGALRFALRGGFAGVVAVSPHIDLDISAVYQGRRPHVAAVLGTEDVENPVFYPVTREIRELAASADQLPRLVIQSTADDAGVHDEQVLPLVDLWRVRGGPVRTSFYEHGGHTSEYATPEFFTDAIEWCLGRSG